MHEGFFGIFHFSDYTLSFVFWYNLLVEIKTEQSFGVIPIYKDKDNISFVCLIRHAQGHWGFPKGHQNLNESEEETAIREMEEESGINDIEIIGGQSYTEKYFFEKDGSKHNKSVKYFLGFVSSVSTTTPDHFKKEIPELKWVIYEEAKQLITFEEAKKILDKVFHYILND